MLDTEFSSVEPGRFPPPDGSAYLALSYRVRFHVSVRYVRCAEGCASATGSDFLSSLGIERNTGASIGPFLRHGG